MPQPPSRSYQAVLRSYVDSDKVNRLSMEAEAIYLRSLVVCDYRGVLPGSPFIVGGLLVGKRLARGQVTFEQIQTWLGEIVEQGLASLFEVDGLPYLHLTGYFEARRSDRSPPPTSWPEPPDPGSPEGGTQAEPTPNPAPEPERNPGGTRPATNANHQALSPIALDPKPEIQKGASAPGAPGERGLDPPGLSRKPRRDGRAEMRKALVDWQAQAGMPAPDALVDAMEDFRARRTSNRWALWECSQWVSVFRKAGYEPVVVASAFRESADQGWQGVFPKLPGRGAGATSGAGADALDHIAQFEAEFGPREVSAEMSS